MGREDPLEKEMQPTSVFLLGKPQARGRDPMVRGACGLWGFKELDITQ